MGKQQNKRHKVLVCSSENKGNMMKTIKTVIQMMKQSIKMKKKKQKVPPGLLDEDQKIWWCC